MKAIPTPKLSISLIFVLLGLMGLSTLSAQASPGTGDAPPKPSIIIYDVMSGSYQEGRARLLTDVIRSELFKTGLFSIIERGVVQETGARIQATGPQANPAALLADDARLLALGRAVKADKLLISSVEKFDRTIAISLRIVNVATAVIDYSDNIFLSDENMLFDALKEATAKIDFHYAAGRAAVSQNPEEELRAQWSLLKAEGDDLSFLVQNRLAIDEYLNIRQYDITFTPAQYVAILKANIDPAVIKTFLQAGISYSQTEQAIALGIVRLDRFREVFVPAGYSFEAYLDAYKLGIMDLNQYKDYLKGYQNTYLNTGLGGVSDSFPVASATYAFALGKVSWERFWSPYQRGTFKYSTDAGIYLLNMFAPTPFIQANIYAGSYPYYFKAGVGGFAEVILGGHSGVLVQAGLEILEVFDFSVMWIPYGSQPEVSYTDLSTRQGEAGYVPLQFPYAGFVATFKMPFPLR